MQIKLIGNDDALILVSRKPVGCTGGAVSNLQDGWSALPEVAAEDRHRIRAKPPVENPRIHCAKIRLVPDVAAAVLQRRIGRIGIKRCCRAVNAPADWSSNGHHDPGCAMVGALAAVFRNPPAELRELEYQRRRTCP
jgi:hypothetical protein